MKFIRRALKYGKKKGEGGLENILILITSDEGGGGGEDDAAAAAAPGNGACRGGSARTRNIFRRNMSD